MHAHTLRIPNQLHVTLCVLAEGGGPCMPTHCAYRTGYMYTVLHVVWYGMVIISPLYDFVIFPGVVQAGDM